MGGRAQPHLAVEEPVLELRSCPASRPWLAERRPPARPRELPVWQPELFAASGARADRPGDMCEESPRPRRRPRTATALPVFASGHASEAARTANQEGHQLQMLTRVESKMHKMLVSPAPRSVAFASAARGRGGRVRHALPLEGGAVFLRNDAAEANGMRAGRSSGGGARAARQGLTLRSPGRPVTLQTPWPWAE